MNGRAGPSDDGRSLTLTIPQAARLLGISISKAYAAARCGDLPTIRLGTRVLVSRRRLEELIDGPGPPGERDPDDAGRHGRPARDRDPLRAPGLAWGPERARDQAADDRRSPRAAERWGGRAGGRYP
jgi:excisionase family DNA binding protein